MVAYTLDLTGLSQANRVLNEIRDVSKEGHRIFVPEAGAFYTRQFEIRNSSNGQLLQPGTQYILLNMDRNATIQSGLNVCTVVYIRDMSVTSVTMTYQCVGGVYQNTQSVIEERLKDYLDGTTPADVVGSLAGVPYQLPPEAHLHIGEKTVYGFNDMVSMLGMIKQAIITGDNGMIALLFQHIDMVVADAEKRLSLRINEATERVNQLDTQTEIGIGRFIFTDNPANPNTYLGYGEWILNPNVFLYGANLDETPGDLIYIDSGNGNIGRKTYIWQRVESTGAISYSLLSSTSTVNEGETITFTLNTTGLTPGTVIPYTISGVSGADIAGGLLTGKFNLGAGGVATTQVRILEDNLTEGNETLRIRLTNMPSVETSVNINDTSLSPSISLRFSANSNGTGTITTANEGQTVYLVISATNVPVGSIYNLHYNNSTMNDADFTGVRDTTVKIDTATTIIPYAIKADYATETSEVLAVAVSKGTYAENIAATTLTVVDSSKNTEWSVRFSSNTTGTDTITSVDEGTTIYAIVEGKYVPSSFSGQLIYSGIDTSANGDLVNPSFPTFEVIAGDSVTYRATIAIKADTLTEGTEVLTATFRNSVTNATLATGTVVINDTSTSPTYQLKFSSNTSGTDTITSLNEGGVGYAYLRTTNIPNGTVLQVQWGGTASADDFTSTRATTATVSNGIATVALSVKADVLTEGQETVTIAFLSNGTTVATGSLIINDTSVTPEYNIRFSSNSSGTGTITSTNEGATIYLVVETKNVANNTKLYLKYASVTGTVNNDDFVGTRATEVTVVNNSAIVPVTLRNDLTAEGSETMRTSLMTGSVSGPVVDTTDLQINDTSVPSFNIYFSTNANGTGSVTGVNEGSTVYCVVETQGVADGTVLGLSYSLTSADFEGVVPTNVTINANKGIVSFTMKNDFLTEGNETLVVTALRSNVTIATGTVVINDTSRSQEFSGRWSSSSTGSGTITSANEGATVYYVVDTQNVPNGTVIPLRILEGNTVVPAAQFDTLPTSITVNNNVGIATVKFKADSLYETAKTYEAVLTHSTGSSVGGATIRVNDTSYPATAVKFVSGSGTTYTDMTQLEEGNTYYIAVDMRTAPKGTAYQLSFSGTAATLADFVAEGSNIVPNTVYNRVSNTIMEYLPIAVKGDLITEGNETLTVSLSVNGEVRSSHTVTILDTSKNTTATIRFTGSEASNTAIANINEGATVWLVVTTTNVTNGTVFDLEWSGSTSTNDWTATLPTSISITNNRGVVSLTARNDQAIDGAQTTRVTLVNRDTGTSLGQAQLQVLDTSTPAVALALSTATANEGATVNLTATVTGTRDITAWVDFIIVKSDGTAAQADFDTTLPIKVNSTSNYQTTFTTSVVIKADKLTEGTETFTITALYKGLQTSKATATLTVNDTSLAEGYTAFFASSSTATATNNITTVNEGSVFYYIVETVNVANGTVLTIQYPTGVGLVDATDFDGTRPTTLTINNNRGYISLSSKADGSFEGNEKLTVRGLNSSGVQLVSTDITVVDTSQPTISVYLERNLERINYGLVVPMPQAYDTIRDFALHIDYNDVAPGLKLHVKYWFDFDPSDPNYVLQGESQATYALLSAFMTTIGSYSTTLSLPELIGGSDRPQNNLHIRIYLDDWRTVSNPRLAKNGSHTGKLNYTYTDGWPYGHRVVIYKLSSVPNPNDDQPWNAPQAHSVGDWTSQTAIDEGATYGIWVISRGPWYDSSINHFRYIYDGKTYTAAELLATGQVETAPPSLVQASPQNGSNNYKWKRAGTITFRADKTTEGTKTLTVEVGPSATFPRKVTQPLRVNDTSTTAGATSVDGITRLNPGALIPLAAMGSYYKTHRRPQQVYLGQVVASVDNSYALEEETRGNFAETEHCLPATEKVSTVLTMGNYWFDPYVRGPTTVAGIDPNTPFKRYKVKLDKPEYRDALWLTNLETGDLVIADSASSAPITVNPTSKPTNTITVSYGYIYQAAWLPSSTTSPVIVLRIKTTGLADGTKVIPVFSNTDFSLHKSVKNKAAVVPAFNLGSPDVFPENGVVVTGEAMGFIINPSAVANTYTPTSNNMNEDTLQFANATEGLYSKKFNYLPYAKFFNVTNNYVTIPFYMSQLTDTTLSHDEAIVDTYKFQVTVNGVKQPTWFDFDFVVAPQLRNTELGVLRSSGVTTSRHVYLEPLTATEVSITGGGGGGGGSGYMGVENIGSGTPGGTSTLTIEGSNISPTIIAYAGGGAGGADGRTADANAARRTAYGGSIGNWLGAGVWNGVTGVVGGRQLFPWVASHPNLYPVAVVYMRYTSRLTINKVTISNYMVAYSQNGANGTTTATGVNTGTHTATFDRMDSMNEGGFTYKIRNVYDSNIPLNNHGFGGAGGGATAANEAYKGVAGGAGAIMRVVIVNRGESPIKLTFNSGEGGVGGRAGGYATTVTTADTGYASRVGKNGSRGVMMITRIWRTAYGMNYVTPANAPILQHYTTTTYVTLSDLGLVSDGLETVNGTPYAIYRNVEIREAFYNKFKRYPKSQERVYLTITNTQALVGGNVNDAGLTVSSLWPADAPLVIQNNGLILGLGGKAGQLNGSNHIPSYDGKTGIKNLSSVTVTVNNSGVVAGGGGAGGMGQAGGTSPVNPTISGGGGAPFGGGGGTIGTNKTSNGNPGTLSVGGKGGYVTRYPNEFGGSGGAWGRPGTNGSRFNQGLTQAGYAKEGIVIIANSGTGWWRGREGSSGI